jgi:hypothetical protein
MKKENSQICCYGSTNQIFCSYDDSFIDKMINVFRPFQHSASLEGEIKKCKEQIPKNNLANIIGTRKHPKPPAEIWKKLETNNGCGLFGPLTPIIRHISLCLLAYQYSDDSSVDFQISRKMTISQYCLRKMTDVGANPLSISTIRKHINRGKTLLQYPLFSILYISGKGSHTQIEYSD